MVAKIAFIILNPLTTVFVGWTLRFWSCLESALEGLPYTMNSNLVSNYGFPLLCLVLFSSILLADCTPLKVVGQRKLQQQPAQDPGCTWLEFGQVCDLSKEASAQFLDMLPKSDLKDLVQKVMVRLLLLKCCCLCVGSYANDFPSSNMPLIVLRCLQVCTYVFEEQACVDEEHCRW